ncbi:hypothetical protein EBU99_14875, partial [bacterium]|nr:hypothetical protein [bacterium]
MQQTKDLIRGFENVVKLIESLSQVLGKKTLEESAPKKPLQESIFPSDLPEIGGPAESLHEDFESILGIKKPVAPETTSFDSLKADAIAMVENLKLGKVSDDEAHQILSFMAESLDGAVESVIKENNDDDDKECVICGRQ